MTEKTVKEGYELAEKELAQKQVNEVKNIVLKTLEKIRDKEKIRDEVTKQIKILKMDIDDLKSGKLDRIVERQEKDKEAKDTSVVIIIKETNNNYYGNPWYIPYHIVWQYPYYQQPFFATTTQNLLTGTSLTFGSATSNTLDNQFQCSSITCSVAKDATIGTYDLPDGSVTYIR